MGSIHLGSDRKCAMQGCGREAMHNDAFCARHLFEVQLADEIEHQPIAADIAAEIAWAAAPGGSAEPPPRPKHPVKDWA